MYPMTRTEASDLEHQANLLRAEAAELWEIDIDDLTDEDVDRAVALDYEAARIEHRLRRQGYGQHLVGARIGRMAAGR